MDRRTLLVGGAATAAYLGLSGFSRAEDTLMRMAWWGGQSRAERTLQALAIYAQQHPGHTVDTEYLGWDDYWPRIATQSAGGNAPDVLQMDIEYLAEYASRGVLLDLDSYVGSALSVGDFDPAVLDNGKVGGKLYAVANGVNAVAIAYNSVAYEEAGVAPPDASTTWEQFAQLTAEFSRKTKRQGMFGTADGSAAQPVLETWLRQRGKELYTPQGKLAYDAGDITEWFQMWADMRAAGSIPPGDIEALGQGSIDNSLFAQSRAAVAWANSNEYVAYQSFTPDPVRLSPYPRVGADGKGGLYVKPSQFFAVSARSRNPEAAVVLLNFLLTDPAATTALGSERGIPASAAVRQRLSPSMDEADKLMSDYISGLGELAGALPPPQPPGNGEITDAFSSASQEVSFGAKSPADAAADYIARAEAVLTRA
ncbi:ABC transporter substrate-binding protein [Devosia sp. Root413D1]|uniref:ABC transporter substrate-binding protein n=1 Tax=Devosia sp. Root413D1 TaxID=1736531 RepID=UPI00138EFC78|nr:extracellular solute-binding protein [Devosia sp. Root413D1]